MERLTREDKIRIYVAEFVGKQFGGDIKRMINEYQSVVEETFGSFPVSVNLDQLEWARDEYVSRHFGREDAARRDFAVTYLGLLKKRLAFSEEAEPGYAKSMEYATALALFTMECYKMQIKASWTRALGLEELSRKLMPNRTGLSFREMEAVGRKLNSMLNNPGW